MIGYILFYHTTICFYLFRYSDYLVTDLTSAHDEICREGYFVKHKLHSMTRLLILFPNFTQTRVCKTDNYSDDWLRIYIRPFIKVLTYKRQHFTLENKLYQYTQSYLHLIYRQDWYIEHHSVPWNMSRKPAFLLQPNFLFLCGSLQHC